jgi:hypothetical protein
MARVHNAKLTAGSVLERCHCLMSSWVVRATLLSLGGWSAYPQPNALFFFADEQCRTRRLRKRGGMLVLRSSGRIKSPPLMGLFVIIAHY